MSLQFSEQSPSRSRALNLPLGRRHDQLAVFEAHGAEKADALTRRGIADKPDRPLRAAPTCGSASRAVESELHPWPTNQCRLCAPVRRSFFVRRLQERIVACATCGRGLRKPKAQLAEQSLTLANFQFHAQVRCAKTPTGLAHPTSGRSPRPNFLWTGTQRRLDFGQVAGHSSDWDVRCVDLRPSQPVR